LTPQLTLKSEKIFFNKYFDFFDLQEFDAEQIDNSKLSRERSEELRLMNWEVDTLCKNVLEGSVTLVGDERNGFV
jgi:hypothetical protein